MVGVQTNAFEALPVSSIRAINNAVLAPFGPPEFNGNREQRRAGVMDAELQPVDVGPLGNFRITALPPTAEDVPNIRERLEGTWLFGGFLKDHFGHFLTNSIGRLWAAQFITNLRGVVYLADQTHRTQSSVYEAAKKVFGFPEIHRLINSHCDVEHLVLADDLFCEMQRCRASPAFNNWVRQSLPKCALQQRDIYVTRGQFDPTKGRILCEDVLEKNLREAGYEIFAPETASLEEQVLTYRAARRIVAADGSALHLVAFCAHPDAKVACVQRRSALPSTLRIHLETAVGERFIPMDCVKAYYYPQNTTQAWIKNRSMAEIDFGVLHTRLLEEEFVAPGHQWTSPGEIELLASMTLGLPKATNYVKSILAKIEPQSREPRSEVAHEVVEVDAKETVFVGMPSMTLLKRLTKVLRPDWLLELGRGRASILTATQANLVSVANMGNIEANGKQIHVLNQTPVEFFASGFAERNSLRFDLAVLHGRERFETLLHEFVHLEELMNENGLIVLTESFPKTVTDNVGEIWKLLKVLRTHRPDLETLCTNAHPNGVAIVRGCDPSNLVLRQKFAKLIAEYSAYRITTDADVRATLADFDLQLPWRAISALEQA